MKISSGADILAPGLDYPPIISYTIVNLKIKRSLLSVRVASFPHSGFLNTLKTLLT